MDGQRGIRRGKSTTQRGQRLHVPQWRGLLATLGYSQKGLGVLFTAKMVDNMSFRSDRDLRLFDLPINYIPAVTQQHTYNLAATLYPYATVITGETSASAEIFYTIPKGSQLGGKYGTKLSASFAAANSLDTTHYAIQPGRASSTATNETAGDLGDELFVRDFNVSISRKFNKVEGQIHLLPLRLQHADHPCHNRLQGHCQRQHSRPRDPVESEAQAEPAHRASRPLGGRRRVRSGVVARQRPLGHRSDGIHMEPHWFAQRLDQYNFGNNDPKQRIHYVYGSAGYINGPTD